MSIPGFSLKGKAALVTGGKRGIGKAIALAFAEAGADVAICSRGIEDGELEAVAKEIERFGRRSLAVQADISVKNDVDLLVQRTTNELGTIDILVNNAAIMVRGPLLELHENDWDKVIDINLKGSYLCSQAVGKRMVEKKRGNIINITSALGIRPAKEVGAYAIAKAGLNMLTRMLALELGGFNIRVNGIAASYVKTAMSASQINADSEKRISATIPLGRMSEPIDVVGTALFLACDVSNYITGHILPVDGGRLI